jgi:hypothetical protein
MEDQTEQAIPFLIYDQNTKGNKNSKSLTNNSPQGRDKKIYFPQINII